MKKLIVIADWVNDSLTCQEYKSALCGYLRNKDGLDISFVSSSPSTIHGSFLLSQVIETEERYGNPLGTVVFLNIDPRLNSVEGVENAKGAELIISKLQSGIFVCGPNAGYNFSMIKKKMNIIFYYPGLSEGSQFRSRDLYTRVCAHLMDEMEEELDLDEVASNIILEISGFFITHVDNFGNLKTNIPLSLLKGKRSFGDMLKVKIGLVEKNVLFVNNLFGSNLGQLVIYPGSSGIKTDPYLEVTIRRSFSENNPSTGWEEYKYPKPGTEIFLK